MTKQTLALVATHTATAYRFQTTDPGLMSWAICTVNDATGELLITSDWGNWSYRWDASPRALGAPSLTAFLGDRSPGNVDYLARKLQGSRGHRFSAEKTVAAWRLALCERRLEVGHRVGHPLTRALAREIWDALGDAADECGGSFDLFLSRVYEIDGFAEYVDEHPSESFETEQTPEDRTLREVILPALIAACKAATTAAAEEPPCAR